MNSISFKSISIRGRVAYLIMCFERYVTAKYPDRSWVKVSEMMWKICDESDYIDNSAAKYMEIIPEYLYEFSNYSDAEFDFLTKEEFDYFISIIPNNDHSLNTIMHAIYSVAMEYAYVAMEKNAPETYKYLNEVFITMEKERIPFPDFHTIEEHQFSEANGWGHAFDGKHLSIISK